MPSYSSSRWHSMRERALDRDNHWCQSCGETKNLEIHHIQPAREFDSLVDAHYLENLVTLCQECHQKWEGDRRRPKIADAGQGLSVLEVADRLAADSARRIALKAAIGSIYWEWIHLAPGVCSNCLRRAGGGPEQFRYAKFCKTVAEATMPGKFESEFSSPRHTEKYVRSFCDECAGGEKRHIVKRYEMVKLLIRYQERLGMPVDAGTARHVFGERFERPVSGPSEAVGIQRAILAQYGMGSPPETTPQTPESYVPHYRDEVSKDNSRRDWKYEYLDWYKDSMGLE